MEFLSTRYFGNPVSDYLYAAAVFAATLAALYLLRAYGLARLKALAARTSTDIDDLLIDLVYAIKAPEYHLLALYAAARYLELPPAFDKALFAVILVAVSVRAVTLAQKAAVVKAQVRFEAAGKARFPSLPAHLLISGAGHTYLH